MSKEKRERNGGRERGTGRQQKGVAKSSDRDQQNARAIAAQQAEAARAAQKAKDDAEFERRRMERKNK